MEGKMHGDMIEKKYMCREVALCNLVRDRLSELVTLRLETSRMGSRKPYKAVSCDCSRPKEQLGQMP